MNSPQKLSEWSDSTSTTRRLWIGFGIEQILLVLCVLIIGLRVRSIETEVRGMADAREYSSVARDLEIDVQSYALAVGAFLRTHDPRSRDEAQGKAGAVDMGLASYEAFAARPVAGASGGPDTAPSIGERFRADWRELRQEGAAFLVDGIPPPASADLARFRSTRLRLQSLLEGEMKSAATRLYDSRREEVLLDAHAVVGLALIMLAVTLLIGVVVGLPIGRTVLRNEDKLHEQREQLRTTLASIGDAVITTDTRGCIVFLNGVAEALTGWSHAEAEGKSVEQVFRVIHARTREKVDNPVSRVLAEGAAVGVTNDCLLLSRAGAEVPIDENAAPIRDAEGRVAGCVLIFRDVSEQKRAEAALRASRERKALILRTSLNPIVTFDGGGRVVELNPVTEHLFGYAADEVVGRNLNMLMPLLYLEEPDGQLAEYLDNDEPGATGKGMEVAGLRKDGTTFPIEVTIVSFLWNGERLFSAFIRDISHEKENEKRVYALLTELREADRRKDEFLATLAHELRNPLAPIRNMLEAMKRADTDLSLVHQAREMMERQVAQMVRLVDDLLDVSRITRNRLELRKERVELASVIHHAIEMCRPLIQSARHEFVVSLPTEPIYLEADPVRLSQVFSNLLNNSCKYTAPGGSIWLLAERQDGEVVVRVRDNGIGLSAEMLPRIFEMFTQVDRSPEGAPAGLGIGLAIVKQLVGLHSGQLVASSDGPGLGSQFEVRLPVLTDRVEAPVSLPTDDLPPLRSRSILVVDDNRDSAVSLALLLKFGGNRTHTAFDGLEAVEAAERFRPDIVLLDIGLPKLDGHEAARRIREQPWGREIVLVAMTGWGQDEDRRKSKEAGFNHHMVKPLDIAALRRLLSDDPA